MNTRVLKQHLYFMLFRGVTVMVVLFFLLMIGIFLSNGTGVVDLTFLTEMPRRGMTEGGILPAILGTVYITLLTIVITLPVGVASAVYLVEYTGENRFVKIVNSAIANLAGIPSIIFGLFGFGLFVVFLGFNTSILSGALTMFLLILPLVVSASREALLSVPKSFREASLALGATKWQTVRHNVIPQAIPGILTGAILATARAAGETAPIMLTAAFFYSTGIPDSIFKGTLTLSTHIYYLATQHQKILLVRPIVYGTVLVLLALVLSLNLVAIVVRIRYRRRRKW